MSHYYYDLHLHSCLSPCADDDMTPANIVGMASLNGLQIIALTDHNSAANCPPFFTEARRRGLIPIGGMELTVSEDIHAVCLFPDLESTMAFDRFVAGRRARIKNRTEIFGRQILYGEDDHPIGEIEELLIPATDISLSEAHAEVTRRGGVCYPAHVDRTANGILAVLGDLPPEPRFTAYELHDAERQATLLLRHPPLSALPCLVSSDAHRLEDIAEACVSLPLPKREREEQIRQDLISFLRGENGGISYG